MARPLITPELARLLSVGQRTVWRLLSEGELPEPVRMARRITRWRLVDIRRWIDSLDGDTRR